MSQATCVAVIAKEDPTTKCMHVGGKRSFIIGSFDATEGLLQESSTYVAKDASVEQMKWSRHYY
jgi:hypothetical protein